MHNASMPNVLIRDLPEHVHRELSLRASARGQSLQQFLTGELMRLAATPTLESVFTRISERATGKVGLEQAVEDLAAGRGE